MKAAFFLTSLILLAPAAGKPVLAWESARAHPDGCTPWVLESIDGGTTWHPPKPAPPSRQGRYDAGPKVAVHPKRPEVAFLATADGVFVRRRQSGRWRPVYVDHDWRCTADLLIDPVEPRRMHLMSCVNGKLWQTLDGGREWRRRYLPSFDDALAFDMDLAQPSTLYVALDDLLFVSHDRGRTWDGATPEGFPVIDEIVMVRADPRTSGIVYATINDDALHGAFLVRSTDYGTTWQTIPDIALSDLAFDPHAAGSLVGVRYDEVWRSRDNGESWTQVRESDTGPFFSDIAFDPGVPGRVLAIATEAAGFSQLYESRDSGETWAILVHATLGRVTSFAVAPSNPDRIYVAGCKQPSGG